MIRIVEDSLLPPAVVIGVDMLTLELAPDYNEIATYVMTGAGYGAGLLGLGSTSMQNFLIKMGMSSLPLTARAIRERIKAGMGSRVGAGATRLALRRVTPSPSSVGRAYQPEFEKAGAFAI